MALIYQETFSEPQITFMKSLCDQYKKTDFTRNEIKEFAILHGQQWAPSWIVKNEAMKKRNEKGEIIRGLYDLKAAIESTPVVKAEKVASEPKQPKEKKMKAEKNENEMNQPKATSSNKKTKKAKQIEHTSTAHPQ